MYEILHESQHDPYQSAIITDPLKMPWPIWLSLAAG